MIFINQPTITYVYVCLYLLEEVKDSVAVVAQEGIRHRIYISEAEGAEDSICLSGCLHPRRYVCIPEGLMNVAINIIRQRK